MHAIHASYFHKYKSCTPVLGKPSTLYQWGKMREKEENSRYSKVDEKERQKIGVIGLGSSASGGKESLGEFCGAGEGIIYENAFRITKGNVAHKMEEADQYWILQVSAFKNAVTFSQKMKALSRQDLLDKLLLLLNIRNTSFISTFVASFHSESAFVSRSNGILPTDTETENIQNYRIGFESVGGHILGNLGTTINIDGPILIEPILDFKCLS